MSVLNSTLAIFPNARQPATGSSVEHLTKNQPVIF
jgi:hypothetical protein